MLFEMKKQPQSPAPDAAPGTGGTPRYGHFGQPPVALPGPPADNYCGLDADPLADASEADRRAAYTRHDPRYAGGDRFELQKEQTGL